jgi:hypothetical protein
MKNHTSTFKASNASQTLQDTPSQSTIRHAKRYGHKPARHKDHNLKNQYGTPSFFETHFASSRNPKKQRKTTLHSLSFQEKTRKNLPIYYLQSTLESAFQTYMNLHAGSTWQAERTPKNTITIQHQRTATQHGDSEQR